MSQQQTVSPETLKAILDAFNAHDLDAIMEFFAEDCLLEMPRGPEPWGQRFTGKAAVRDALATRFRGLPDVHYGEDRHWVSGDLGVSEWLLTGTPQSGPRIAVRGCDHWEFRDGAVVRKDSYWKIVEPPKHVLHPIGRVRSTLTDPARAPKQGDEGAPEAWLEFADDVAPGLRDVRQGDHVIVLTWLDRADRATLEVHPRDDASAPLRGVFSTRSADRPNPIGLHRVEVLEVETPTRMRVRPLEAVDGTPVLDVKPALGPGER
jgi:tRNA-Thr(GGU) m(6)t(6)A37 methyltransferase TsaA